MVATITELGPVALAIPPMPMASIRSHVSCTGALKSKDSIEPSRFHNELSIAMLELDDSSLMNLKIILENYSWKRSFAKEPSIVLRLNDLDLLLSPSPSTIAEGPCEVEVNIFLRSISKISDLDMEYSVQITFREKWKDERLQYDDQDATIKFLTLTEPEKIWKPDLFFSELSIEKIEQRNFRPSVRHVEHVYIVYCTSFSITSRDTLTLTHNCISLKSCSSLYHQATRKRATFIRS